MIILIGASGYIGSAFKRELGERRIHYIPVSHYHAEDFIECYPDTIDLVINCAAFIPTPSVALCDESPTETITGNVIFPATISRMCRERGIVFAQISTGCLWSDGQEHSEEDEPQRSFTGHCGFYVGTKILAEQVVRKSERHYIWRVRLPFDEFDCDRNYLSKLARFEKVFDHVNSISHRRDFVKACIELWLKGAAFGTYNVVNEGSVSAQNIVKLLSDYGIITRIPEFTSGLAGDSKLSVAKLLATGVTMRPVEEAILESISNFK